MKRLTESLGPIHTESIFAMNYDRDDAKNARRERNGAKNNFFQKSETSEKQKSHSVHQA